MPFQSRWKAYVPDAHLATLLFQSPDHALSKSERSFVDVDHPDTHFLTRHEFRLWSQRFAAGLRKSGLRPGDRVLLFSGNSIFFPVIYMGIIMAGGIFTSANSALVPRELAYQLKDSGATLMICAEASIETALAASDQIGLSRERAFVLNLRAFETEKGIQNSTNPGVDISSLGCRDWSELLASEDEGRQFRWDELNTPDLSARTLALNYSSGTTGVPKGVEVSHKNVIANILQFNHLARLDPKYAQRVLHARWICPLPMYHAMGQNMFVGIAFTRGIPVYLMSKFNYDKFLRAIGRFRITDLTLVPPIVVRMAKDREINKYDLSSIQSIFCGAAPLGKEGCAEAEALWPAKQVNIKQGWGMTEYVVANFLCALLRG
jgi:acyl-CoA synthetase (AMP-forming)/AMP-acid ligase II